MFSIKASEEGFETINLLSYLLSVYKNPALFPFDFAGVPDAERQADIQEIESALAELIG